jgi:hypothetical protein
MGRQIAKQLDRGVLLLALLLSLCWWCSQPTASPPLDRTEAVKPEQTNYDYCGHPLLPGFPCP